MSFSALKNKNKKRKIQPRMAAHTHLRKVTSIIGDILMIIRIRPKSG